MRGIGASIVDHLRLRHPTGAAATRYNVLQKLAYLVVVFGLLPLVVLMGLGMSPRLDTLFGGWVDWFGGRQSVRSLHFIAAWLIVAFVVIHGEPVHGVLAFALGLYLGLVTERAESVVPAVLCHAANNSVSVVLSAWVGSSGSLGVNAAIFLVTAPVVAGAIRWMNRRPPAQPA